MTKPEPRRMPQEIQDHLMEVQRGKQYLPVAYRVKWFRDECPLWGIDTTVIEGGQAEGFATVQARIYTEDGRIIAAGTKTETQKDFPAGWVEKAETGAIGRALAMAGFGTQFTDDLDEGHRICDTPRAAPRAANGNGDAAPAAGPLLWDGPGQCPKCHAPEGKKHGKPCV